jgi:hypothetical protein
MNLGGWVFLMSEVPLYAQPVAHPRILAAYNLALPHSSCKTVFYRGVSLIRKHPLQDPIVGRGRWS